MIEYAKKEISIISDVVNMFTAVNVFNIIIAVAIAMRRDVSINILICFDMFFVFFACSNDFSGFIMLFIILMSPLFLLVWEVFYILLFSLFFMGKSDDKKQKVEDKSSSWRFLIVLGKFFWFILKIPYFIVKYIYLSIKFIVKYAYSLIKYLFSKSKTAPSLKDVAFVKGKIRDDKPNKSVSFDVLESLKGTFDEFFDYLKTNDSFIAIVIGARGFGKTAVSLSFVEALRGFKENYFAMGFSNDALPEWIYLVDSVAKIKNDSLVLIDEGGILFSSRDSMSDANKVLSDLLMISRHKNISIVFISQNSSNLEVNTLRQADILILKKHSLLQKNFERKIIAKLYNEYESYFEKYKKNKGASLIFSDQFVGFLNVGLPSFWSNKTSKSFEHVPSQSKSKKSKKSSK